MFLGLAREMKRKLNVPILCSLQGEDIFLEELPEPFKSQTKELLRSRAKTADGFVAPSSAYAEFMSHYLEVDRERIHVVPLGINLEGHGGNPRRNFEGPIKIGYLARICPEKGLHLLVKSFDLLVQRSGKSGIRLEVAGYLGPRDQAYFEEILKTVSRSGWQSQFRYWGEVDRERKLEFLSSLDILSVPTVYRDPKGLFVLEALANEVPVVQPAHGSFPELIERTGGGRLVEPNSASALAKALQMLIEDPEERKRLGEQGKIAVYQKFSDMALAERALAVYRQYV
jgi:glycosyltransferase involved in cell wall biosynthesis